MTVIHVPTHEMLADLLTKALGTVRFYKLARGIVDIPAKARGRTTPEKEE